MKPRQRLFDSKAVARKVARQRRQRVYLLPDAAYYVGSYEGALRASRRHPSRPRLAYSPQRPRRRRKKGLLDQLMRGFGV